MRYGALVASLALALALTASGQRGTAHGAYSGHGSSGGHAGFAGHGGFTGHTGARGNFGGLQHFGPSGFRGNSTPFAASGFRGMSRPFAPSGFRGNAPVAYSGRFGSPVFRGSGYGSHSGYRMPYRGRSDYGNHQRGGDHRRGWDRDRDHHRWNGAGYLGSYAYGGPAWYSPYPFVVDPGFYDWGDSEYDQGNGYAYSPADLGPQYEPQDPPAEEYEPAQPAPRPAYAPAEAAALQGQGPQQQSSATSLGTQHSLTVIFKNGRAPEKIGNYMVNSKTLTDLDQDHYEEIPIDQIDVAATEQSNRVHGLHFEVPGTLRD